MDFKEDGVVQSRKSSKKGRNKNAKEKIKKQKEKSNRGRASNGKRQSRRKRKSYFKKQEVDVDIDADKSNKKIKKKNEEVDADIDADKSNKKIKQKNEEVDVDIDADKSKKSLQEKSNVDIDAGKSNKKKKKKKKKKYIREIVPNRQLRISNISSSVENEELRNFFKDCGEIEHILWVNHLRSGQFRNWGYCTFATQEGATEAYKMSGKKKFLGQTINIQYTKGIKKEPSKRLAIMNLPSSVTNEEIRKFFEDYGEIEEDIYWIGHQIGVVCTFATQEEATKAYKMSGTKFLGRMIEIQYAEGKISNNLKLK